jgi:hypothetical protein
MLISKQTTLKPLLESESGVHLTIYLVNRRGVIDLKSQLKTAIQEAYKWLEPAFSIEEQKQFLEPLESLLVDARIFKQMKGNIGIFRTKDSFRVLNIPVEVEPSCQVATSFHVKPLLRWLQTDQEFLLLGIESDSAHLYLGSQDSFRLVDSILFPEFFKKNYEMDDYSSLKESRKKKIKQEETFNWLNEWITELTKNSKPKLFLAGDQLQVSSLLRHLKYRNAIKAAVANSFTQQNLSDICQTVRKILKTESHKLIEKTLVEFRFAEEGNRTRKNIFQIARAVVQGKVRKLIVTDELSIFGKVDRKSGGLAIHPFDLDHEDDDILDDLAQMVLSQGGEVIIAKRNEIPKGHPILAILDDEDLSLEKNEGLQYDVRKEMLG